MNIHMQKKYVVALLVFLFVAASAFVIWFSLGATQSPQEIRGQAYGESGGGNTGGGNTGGGGNTVTCSEAPVNVQFRKWTGQDTPWIDGRQLELKAGEYVEVNCFAKNGTALLSNPRMSATVTANGKTEAITLSNPNSAEVRKLQVLKTGTYTFTCKNASNSCSDTDQFAVAGGTTSDVCKRAGCSGQLCVAANAADLITTCEWKPEYACYQQAECKVQANGQCGFTPSDTLTQCLNNAGVSPTPTPSASATPTPAASASPTLCGNGNYAASDLNRDCRTDIQDYAIFFNDYRQSSGL